MKILIVNLITRSLSGGYQKYLLNILPRIEKSESVKAIGCLLPDFTQNFIYDTAEKIRFIQIPYYRLVDYRYYAKITSVVTDFNPDVVYIPVEKFFTYKDAPVVIMLQNMEPFICPFESNPFKERIKNLVRHIIARTAVKRADRVIAISGFVKEYLINKMGINPNKIGIVYHGIDDPKGMSKRPDTVPETLGGFLFTAGSIRPARGLEDVMDALAVLANRGIKIPLVIAGKAEKIMLSYQKKMEKMAINLGVSELIYWAGHLNDQEMSWCFSNCKVFIMSSRVESFGLTGGEAMAYGAICIAADNPCLPELFQDAAVYYPPKNSQVLAERILEVLSWDDSKRKEMSERAKQRAEQFSWDVCAEKTIEQFQIAIEEFRAKQK